MILGSVPASIFTGHSGVVTPTNPEKSFDSFPFVLHPHGRFLQLLQVLLGMVATEKKLTIRHDHAHVGLCAAGITAICGCQRLLISHCCVHIIIKAFEAKNIPDMGGKFTRGRKPETAPIRNSP